MAYLPSQLALHPPAHTLGQSGGSNNAEERQHFLASHPTDRVDVTARYSNKRIAMPF